MKMRRSSAPSKMEKAAKRGKFCPPFLQAKSTNEDNPQLLESKIECPIQASTSQNKCSKIHSAYKRTTLDVLKLIENVENLPETIQAKFVDVSDMTCASVDNVETRGVSERQMVTILDQTKPTDTTAVDDATKYFRTVWCKLSTRKHKKWEGDAVLQVKKSSTILKDMDGKIIGRGSMYKKADLENLEEGSHLIIGGKEIEIMDTILPEDYYSGRCFLPAFTSNVTEQNFNGPKAPLHLRNKSQTKNTTSFNRPVLPKFDPLKPDALVLPRPDSIHQWKYNLSKKTVVDVVVDPVLSKKLRPHQRDGVIFLYECIMQMRRFNGEGAILADDMGLGKTLQCITIIWTLLKQGPYGGIPILKRVLIATPSSLIKNWSKEFNTWLGHERLVVCAANKSEQIEMFAKVLHIPVLITSYELLMRHYQVLEQIHFDLIVCDEGHRLKNTTTKTSNILNSMSARKRVVLTGTPIQNDLQEFFALVEFCNPGTFESISSFRKLYEEPILQARQVYATAEEVRVGDARLAELSRVTGLFILRRTQDINSKYLPSKTEYVVFCKPTQLQLRIYQKILQSRIILNCLSGVPRDGSFHLICISALRKLCNHPDLVFQPAIEASKLSNQHTEDSPYSGIITCFPPDYQHSSVKSQYSGKIQVLTELLELIHFKKERIVIVSISTKALDLLQKLCQHYNYSFLRLDGSTPTSQRQILVDRFNVPDSNDFVFLLSSKAGGVGLNLIGASRIVLLDIDWNPANDLQAMSRVWREGQRKPVHIYRLITAGTIEEKIYQRQLTKHNLSGALTGSKDNRKIQFTLEELKDLFTLNMTTCNTHDLLECNCCTKETTVALQEHTGSNLETTGRSCQLTIDKPWNKPKNLSMDELMSWKHIPGEALTSEYLMESYLAKAKQSITYVFYNYSTTSTLN